MDLGKKGVAPARPDDIFKFHAPDKMLHMGLVKHSEQCMMLGHHLQARIDFWE